VSREANEAAEGALEELIGDLEDSSPAFETSVPGENDLCKYIRVEGVWFKLTIAPVPAIKLALSRKSYSRI
jgi:hypothetical protein